MAKKVLYKAHFNPDKWQPVLDNTTEARIIKQTLESKI